MKQKIKISILLMLFNTLAISATDQVLVQIVINEGETYSFIKPGGGFRETLITPQIAIWLESEDGVFYETIFITERSGLSNWRKYPFAKDVRRPAALPVWSHMRGVAQDDGVYMPTIENPVADAVTGATPASGFRLNYNLPAGGDNYRIYVEVNNSWDYNDYYTEELLEVPENSHSEKSFSGQPSLVYSATISESNSGTITLELQGHGDPLGVSGSIYSDISKLDTALEIIESVIIQFP